MVKQARPLLQSVTKKKESLHLTRTCVLQAAIISQEDSAMVSNTCKLGWAACLLPHPLPALAAATGCFVHVHACCTVPCLVLLHWPADGCTGNAM